MYSFRNWLHDLERPTQLRDQHFGLALTPADMGAPLSLPTHHGMLSNYYRPWSLLNTKDAGSTMHVDKNNFRVDLDVQHFAPEEIKVKAADGCITVEGTHDEKPDEHGFIHRTFKRRYIVPEGFNVDEAASSLSTDGILTLTVPKLQIEGNTERHVPIKHTGGPHRAVKHTEKRTETKK